MEKNNYFEKSFRNTFGITGITLNKKIHCYCRLGGDWYTNQVTISFTPVNEICDYVYFDKALEERFERQDCIIEEVLQGIREIILEQCPSAKEISITSYIEDSVPKNMPVTVTLKDRW